MQANRFRVSKIRWLMRMVWIPVLLLGAVIVIRADDLGPDMSDCVPGNCPPAFPISPVQCDINNFTYYDDAISVFVAGDLTIGNSAAETEGDLAVGGDIIIQKTGGTYSVGAAGAGSCVPSASETNHLVVRGDVTNPGGGYLIVGAGIDVGHAVVGGNVAPGSVTMGTAAGSLTEGVGTDPAALGIDFDAKLVEINGRSQCWSVLPATGMYDPATQVFSGDGISSLQVFYVDQDITGAGPTFANVPDNATILVNFVGPTRVWDVWGTHWGDSGTPIGAHREQVLFNFYESTSIALGGVSNGDIEAAILAPRSDATVTMIANHNGRFSTGGNTVHSGTGNEFHNYPFIGELPACDWGDHPDTPYATRAMSPVQAPSHVLTQGLYLGSCVDGESNGQPSSSPDTAIADDDNLSNTNPSETLGTCATPGDDEDGVAVNGVWNDGPNGGSVVVDVVAPVEGACLNAWIDWTDAAGNPDSPDGDFNASGDYIIQNRWLSSGSGQVIDFDVPVGTFDGSSGNRVYHARYRLTRVDADGQCGGAEAYGGVATPNGPADSGEVEDYVFNFTPTSVIISQQNAVTTTRAWVWLLIGALGGLALAVARWRLASRTR